MVANELRHAYIRYFQELGHQLLPGAPLIPVDALGKEDTSTLFTSAGMQQFKPYFTGQAVPPATRVVTIQKCMRTGDIDSVGDLSHCTFFEMMGNFSFGDYFKPEVIPWTWEFLTGTLGLDGNQISVTVFKDDEDAFAIWRDAVGLPADRIHMLGEEHNYWPASAITAGPDGPCGPCTEIFYKIDPASVVPAGANGDPTRQFLASEQAGAFVEIWNNVFTQFSRSVDSSGAPLLTPLPNRNNDTGAGLDRIATILQNRTSVFDTDLFAPIVTQIEEIARRKYAGSMGAQDRAVRVVAEHTRSMVFCLADGITPANEGRGYVLRRIMRRAVRFGRAALEMHNPFLHRLAPIVVDAMGDFYPELRERQALITQAAEAEEERFLHTLESGTVRITHLLNQPEVRSAGLISGEDAFMLYDTYGFPLELTEEIARENGVEVDGDGFKTAMDVQRSASRAAMGGDRELFAASGSVPTALTTIQSTQFVGYTENTSDSTVVAILAHGESIPSASPGDQVEIVLDRTPFYAESGGQVGDTGVMTSPGSGTNCGLRCTVTDTKRVGGAVVHISRISEGTASVGDAVTAQVDANARRRIMRNHTATHLLQAALRQVLGDHVHQKGSRVDSNRLRFDFTHPQPMTYDELKAVEQIVNNKILANIEVRVCEDVPIAEARGRGAMALFGEKYGERVRIVEVPGFSVELCGGTHITSTGLVAQFRIQAETGVASGIRRIEAVTGEAAYQAAVEADQLLHKIAQITKVPVGAVLTTVERLQSQKSELEKQVTTLKQQAARGSLKLQEQYAGDILVVTGLLEDAGGESLKTALADTASSIQRGVVVLAAIGDGRTALAGQVTADLVARGLSMKWILDTIAPISGLRGGGRPNFAQAGGKGEDPQPLKNALEAVRGAVETAQATGVVI